MKCWITNKVRNAKLYLNLCFNLDQFGQVENTGHSLQVTGHCLPIQKVSLTFIEANFKPN